MHDMNEPLASESAGATAVPASGETPSAPQAFSRQVLGGGIAAAIALACFLPPLVHFVTGPLGPLLGAFIVAQRLRPDARGCLVIAATLGLAFAVLGAAGATAVVAFAGPSGPPDWFPDTSALALILAGVAAYAAALGGAGAALGARWGRS
jgi:hypothetical protein